MQGGRFFWSGGVAYHFIIAFLPGASANSTEKKKPFLLFYVGAPPLLFPEVFSKADFHNQLSVDFRSDG